MNSEQPQSILIVDDDEYVLKSLTRVLRKSNYNISTYLDSEEAFARCSAQEYDLILSDQRMPGLTGTEFFTRLMQIYPNTRRVLISGYTDFSAVTDAFNDGIIHKFVVKPWDNELLKNTIGDELKLRNAAPEPSAKSASSELVIDDITMDSSLTNYHGILTVDSALLQQIAVIQKTADSEAPFYINGETGTGKELFAKAIHEESSRRNEPFIALNCANLTETLLESQLFGHKKGAFTGAQKDQIGLLSAADGGSLFLDEVTEIPLALQAKLLRVLQEREYTPLGQTTPESFDVKIISASALSLEKAVEMGAFREDLRFRLEVMPISLPPLRARKQDIRELFDYYLIKQFARHDQEMVDVDDEVYQGILSYHWPGNVRELVNVCTYVAALSGGASSIELSSLPTVLHAQSASPSSAITPEKDQDSSPKPRAKVTEESLKEAIANHNGHRESIANEFGISRMTLWRKMKQFNLLEEQ